MSYRVEMHRISLAAVLMLMAAERGTLVVNDETLERCLELLAVSATVAVATRSDLESLRNICFARIPSEIFKLSASMHMEQIAFVTT